MEVTEVRIKLAESNRDKLLAYCTITLDGEFVIRDLKIIQGANGFFVAMPTRKLSRRCDQCKNKNIVMSQYCSQCGAKLSPSHESDEEGEKNKMYAEIAHPINGQCRKKIEDAVLAEYQREKSRGGSPE